MRGKTLINLKNLLKTHSETPFLYLFIQDKNHLATITTFLLQTRQMIRVNTNYYLPSRSAPSSTSPMRSVPAEDSSSNRESVLRSKAMFSIPLVGVLRKNIQVTNTVRAGDLVEDLSVHTPWIWCLGLLLWLSDYIKVLIRGWMNDQTTVKWTDQEGHTWSLCSRWGPCQVQGSTQ